MKHKYLFLFIAAISLLFAGCKSEDLGPEEVTVSGSSSIEIPAEGGEVTVSLKSTLNWELQGYDEDVQAWLVINPSSGKASKDAQTVKIKALKNSDTDRTANIVFYGDVMHKASLTVTQKGLKGEAKEYETLTVAQFLTKKDTGTEYILKGTISDVAKSSSGTYWGLTLTDDTGSIACPFIENWEDYPLKNGDKISIRGKYSYYESKKQDQLANGTIIEYEAVESPKGDPKGTGTLEDPFNASAANAKCAEIGSTASSEAYYVKGKIVTISEISTKYGNATFYISDNGKSTEEHFCVYQVYYLNGDKFTSSDQLKVGDEVIVKGKLINYGDNTPELNKGGQIVSINGTTGDSTGGDGDGEGDKDPVAKPANAAKVTINEFLEKEVNTTDWYEITGTITSIANTSYGNFNVEDETGKVYVYGLIKEWADGKNDKSFSQIGLKVGDKVTFWTLRSENNGTAQAGGSNCPALYISHEAGTETTYPTGSVVLTFPDDNKNNNAANDYTSTWTAKIGSNEFSIENFNNYKWDGWAYIKCGRKKDPSVAKITNATAVEAKVAKVAVTADSYDATSVNSLVMNVYSDSARSTKVCSVDMTSSAKAGEIEFAVPSANQGKGLYYEIVFDCKVSSASKNGFIQISKVAYVAAE